MRDTFQAGTIPVAATLRERSSATKLLHPGDFLVDSVLPGRNVSISQAARDLGVSRQALHRVIARQAPMTPELAVRLEEYTGCAAEVWLLLQMTVDLAQARAAARTRARSEPSAPTNSAESG